MKKPVINLAGMETAETLAQLRSQRVNPNSPMFVKWMWNMATEPSMSTAEKWHATVLALFADWSTGEDCRPSREIVSVLTGLEPRTIKKHMQHFRDLGMIETTTHGGKNRTHTSRLLSPVVARGTSSCTSDETQGYTPDVPPTSSGVHPGASQGYIPVQPSLVLSQLSTHTTLMADASEAPQVMGKSTTTTTPPPAKPTRADDWREALARNTHPAEPKVDLRKDYDKLSEILFTTANGAMARGLAGLEVLSEPIRWLEGGCDLDLDVIPVIKARASRAAPGSIKAWKYFSSGVFEARDRRTAPLADNQPIDNHRRSGHTQPTKEENDDFWARLEAKIKEKQDAKSNRQVPETP